MNDRLRAVQMRHVGCLPTSHLSAETVNLTPPRSTVLYFKDAETKKHDDKGTGIKPRVIEASQNEVEYTRSLRPGPNVN